MKVFGLSQAGIAFVHDALPFMGGAEKTLEALVELFPTAPIYTLFYSPQAFENSALSKRPIYTSFIQHLPFSQKQYRSYLPILPLAIEQFDLSQYDLVISSSYAVAHGIIPSIGQRHVNYIHSPLRQAWQHYHRFLHASGMAIGVSTIVARMLFHYLRLWDRLSADRVDRFVAVSNWVASAIQHTYRRTSTVVYPPVGVDKFKPLQPREDYYLVVSRFSYHKKFP